MEKIKWRVLDEQTYRQKVENMVINHEKDAPRVYLDYTGVPTVGPGKALVVRGSGDKWVISEGRSIEGVNMLEAVRGTKLTNEQYQKLQMAADNLNKYGSGAKAYEANVGAFYKTASVKSEAARLDPANNKFGIEMTAEQQATFKNKVIDATEADFDRATLKSGKVRLDEAVPRSEERAALISLYHQYPSGIDESMRQAINIGDRGGVIKSIEDSKSAEVFKSRRKSEADQFGRPDDPAIVRHENNSQADLDATLKQAPQALPEREVLPQLKAPVGEDVVVESVDSEVKGPASLLDYGGLLKEQLVAQKGQSGVSSQPFVLVPKETEEVEPIGRPTFRHILIEDPLAKVAKEDARPFLLRLFGK